MQKIKWVLLLLLVVGGLFSTTTFACEAAVNQDEEWVLQDGTPASEEVAVACMDRLEKSVEEFIEAGIIAEEEVPVLPVEDWKTLEESISPEGKVMLVVVLLFMLSIPLFFTALTFLIICIVLKKKLKLPLIIVGVCTAIPFLLYIFSIA